MIMAHGLEARDPAAADATLADPNEDRTNLDGSWLWQLGLLELWLQRHVG